MAIPIQVQLSFVYGKLRRLLDFGREHRMKNAQGNLKNSTVAMNIITYVLDKRSDPLVEHMLEHEHCTLFALIDKWQLEYATKHGYIQKRRN